MVSFLIFSWTVVILYLLIICFLWRSNRPSVLFWKLGIITALIRLSALCLAFYRGSIHQESLINILLGYLLCPEALMMPTNLSLNLQTFVQFFVLISIGSFLIAAIFALLKVAIQAFLGLVSNK